MEDEQLINILMELKENVAQLHVKVDNFVQLKEDVDQLKKDVNIVRGVVLAVGAVFSIVIAVFGRVFGRS